MDATTWRTTRSAAVGLILFAIAMAVGTVSLSVAALREGEPIYGLGIAGLGLVPAAKAVVAVSRVQLRADDSGVLVENVLGSHQIAWSEIAEASAGSYGVTIRLNDGGRVVSSLGQKSNASKVLGTRTRGEEIAEAINRRASAHR